MYLNACSMTLKASCPTKLSLRCCSYYFRCLNLFTSLVFSCSFNVLYHWFLSQVVVKHGGGLMRYLPCSLLQI